MNFNLLIFGISYVKGMAGTARVQNFIDFMPDKENHSFSNLIVADPKEPVNYPVSGKINGVDYQVISYNLRAPISVLNYFITGRRYIKSRISKSKNNIFYVYGYPNLSNLYFIRCARKLNYKIVFDIVEDNRYIQSYKSFLSKIKITTSVRIFKHLLKKTEGCITISYHLKNFLIGLKNDNTKICLLPISVNIDNSVDPNETSNIQEPLKIFYGGSFGPKDGLEILFEAFNTLIENNFAVELILTGKGNDALLQKLLDDPKYVKATQKIHYLGYLNKEEYRNTLNSCDIFCMTRIDTPYANAGFPFKLGEMLATGKPVVSSNVGDVPHYLAHMENAILIKPGKVNELVDALQYLILNPSKRVEIGTKGRQVARKFFDARNISRQFHQFLETI
jgi:glycosyltransferase involved in cell wall biosynthesis